MNLETAKSENSCPRRAIAAYVDGELAPREEIEMERHFAVCSDCAAELNEQKNLLRALDFVFEEDEFELPADFTKTVVTRAESNVKGLRCPKERSRALFICTLLFFLVILGLGSETEAVLAVFVTFFGQVWAVGGFVAHLVYDLAFGMSVILRSLGHQFAYSSALALLTLISILTAVLFTLSRAVQRVKI